MTDQQLCDRVYDHISNRTPRFPELGWHELHIILPDLGLTRMKLYDARDKLETDERLEIGDRGNSFSVRLRKSGFYPQELSCERQLLLLVKVFKCQLEHKPASVDTLAKRLKKQQSTIYNEAGELARAGWLTRSGKSMDSTYQLTVEPEVPVWVWTKPPNGRLTSIANEINATKAHSQDVPQPTYIIRADKTALAKAVEVSEAMLAELDCNIELAEQNLAALKASRTRLQTQCNTLVNLLNEPTAPTP